MTKKPEDKPPQIIIRKTGDKVAKSTTENCPQKQLPGFPG
jgi:hypothetical protein